jgi:RHS repeat-associated protein
VAPEGTTLYIGAHFQVFVPTEAPPPDPPPTPPPGLTPRVYLPLAMGGCGYLIDGRVVPPVKYYLFNGRRVAVRQGCSGAVTWFYHDHLGSTVATSAGESTRYWPYGSTRTGAVGTPYRYTGQELDSASGLYYYVARWYDPALGRFLQPDALVQSQGKAPELSLALAVSYSTPAMVTRWNDYQRNLGDPHASVSPPSAPLDPQFLNRYTYARGNPLAYTDDSGHVAWWVVGGVVGAVVGFGAYALTHRDSFDWGQAALWMGGGAVAGATLGLGAKLVAGSLGAKTAATTTGVTATAVGATSKATDPVVRFGQRRISEVFRHGEFAGKTIHEVAAGLRAGTISPDQLPINVVLRDGAHYSMNNRSLMALRLAGLEPTVIRDVSQIAFWEQQLTQRLAEIGYLVDRSFLPIIRQGGQR